MHGNTLIALLVITTMLVTSIFYHNANKSEYIYRKYRGDIMSYLPATRTRSVENTTSDISQLEDALAGKNYNQALRQLTLMAEKDSSNLTLQFYKAVLYEQLGQDLMAIDYYQKVRFNSELFDTQSIRQLILLYIKREEKKRAEEMLAELLEIGRAQDQEWAREMAQVL